MRMWRHLSRHISRLGPMPVLVALNLVNALRESVVAWSLVSHFLLFGSLMLLLFRKGVPWNTALSWHWLMNCSHVTRGTSRASPSRSHATLARRCLKAPLEKVTRQVRLLGSWIRRLMYIHEILAWRLRFKISHRQGQSSIHWVYFCLGTAIDQSLRKDVSIKPARVETRVWSYWFHNERFRSLNLLLNLFLR